MRAIGWIIANLTIIAPAAIAWWLERSHAALYYRAVQEDHWMEWSTVWAFVLAAAAAALAARYQWRRQGQFPWFLIGLGLFCFVVAGEEISWGQRLTSFTPPEYFLADNFQQEMNIHNIVASQLRQLAFQAVVLGYGVILPLTAAFPAGGRLFRRMAIVAPAPRLVPAFAATAIFYAAYPLDYAGEWAELMLGLGMLTAITLNASGLRGAGLPGAAGVAGLAGLAALLTGILGYAMLHATALVNATPEVTRRAAETEIRALAADFAHSRVRTRCGVHKRVYTFRIEWGQTYLSQGRFAGLTAGGLDEKRAAYFLDPWGMPYWIRHECGGGIESVIVYSFGANRRRDSMPGEIRGDDIGMIVRGDR